LTRLFCQDQDFYFQDQDSGSQDQDQDFIFCPRGASRPRLWSRGLHHWIKVLTVWTTLCCVPTRSFTSAQTVRVSTLPVYEF